MVNVALTKASSGWLPERMSGNQLLRSNLFLMNPRYAKDMSVQFSAMNRSSNQSSPGRSESFNVRADLVPPQDETWPTSRTTPPHDRSGITSREPSTSLSGNWFQAQTQQECNSFVHGMVSLQWQSAVDLFVQ